MGTVDLNAPRIPPGRVIDKNPVAFGVCVEPYRHELEGPRVAFGESPEGPQRSFSREGALVALRLLSHIQLNNAFVGKTVCSNHKKRFLFVNLDLNKSAF